MFTIRPSARAWLALAILGVVMGLLTRAEALPDEAPQSGQAEAPPAAPAGEKPKGRKRKGG
jgi:hypothetical protein